MHPFPALHTSEIVRKNQRTVQSRRCSAALSVAGKAGGAVLAPVSSDPPLLDTRRTRRSRAHTLNLRALSPEVRPTTGLRASGRVGGTEFGVRGPDCRRPEGARDHRRTGGVELRRGMGVCANRSREGAYVVEGGSDKGGARGASK